MKRPIALLATLTVLLVPTSRVSAEPSRPAKVTEAMLEMRLVGAMLKAYQREFGVYPAVGSELRPLNDVKKTLPTEYRRHTPANDPWGGRYFYRGNTRSYQIVSFGSDRKPDYKYEAGPAGVGALSPITDCPDENADLILFDGRFTQRPFGDEAPAFVTINAMNRVFVAAAAYAVDHNRYPGEATVFVPVAELAAELVPVYLSELPLEDGWERPLLYFSDGERLILASFGADGEQDHTYYLDLPCGLLAYDGMPSQSPSADIVQACGQFIAWPARTEP